MKLKQISPVKATVAASLLLSGCFSNSIPNILSKSEIQERAERNDDVAGDTMNPIEGFQKFCILNALDLDQHFSESEFRKYYDEDFYIVLTVLSNGSQELAFVHESWLLTPNGSSLCSYGIESITVDRVIEGGTIILVLEDT